MNQIADLLKVPRHPDHLLTLEAICNFVKDRLNPESLKNSSKLTEEGILLNFETCDAGMDLKDPKLNQAAKILRYLFIHDIRNLQTKINECIVAVQCLTANPKTDSKLGQVGF